jgi:hypothetical protein
VRERLWAVKLKLAGSLGDAGEADRLEMGRYFAGPIRSINAECCGY